MPCIEKLSVILLWKTKGIKREDHEEGLRGESRESKRSLMGSGQSANSEGEGRSPQTILMAVGQSAYSGVEE